MLKNLSFLALAGVMTFAATMSACVVVTDDTGTGDGDGDGDPGDGDGDTDSTATGDGDGDDTTTGDGDGDPTGDGDGDDTTTGDGDGDDTTGDGDGDPAACGWDGVEYYICGGEGDDPNGAPIGCPDGLVDGESCPEGLTGIGCCDAEGNNWYCGENDQGETFTVFEAC